MSETRRFLRRATPRRLATARARSVRRPPAFRAGVSVPAPSGRRRWSALEDPRSSRELDIASRPGQASSARRMRREEARRPTPPSGATIYRPGSRNVSAGVRCNCRRPTPTARTSIAARPIQAGVHDRAGRAASTAASSSWARLSSWATRHASASAGSLASRSTRSPRSGAGSSPDTARHTRSTSAAASVGVRLGTGRPEGLFEAVLGITISMGWCHGCIPLRCRHSRRSARPR